MRQVFKKVSVRQKIGVSTPSPPRLGCGRVGPPRTKCRSRFSKVDMKLIAGTNTSGVGSCDQSLESHGRRRNHPVLGWNKIVPFPKPPPFGRHYFFFAVHFHKTHSTHSVTTVPHGRRGLARRGDARRRRGLCVRLLLSPSCPAAVRRRCAC